MRADIGEVMSKVFLNYGISVEHDDRVPHNWNYYFVTNSKYPGKYIRVYAGAEYHDNLTNRKVRNVDAIICFRSEELKSSDMPNSCAFLDCRGWGESGYIFFKAYLDNVSNVADLINSKLAA